jgi:NitT/TauT family transport system ATP-binding protein
MIQVEQLTYSYPGGPPIFVDFDWVVERRESWAILGPSGCGKTTLLYLLAGLRFPQQGRILIDDQVLTRPRPQTGLILQDYGLLPWASVRQNAALGLRVRDFYGPDGTHAPRDFRQDGNVDPWLDRLGLLSQADKYPGEISGGQRQRTAIARTLVLQPDLLLMDEPFSSLDAPTREGLQSLTKELAEEQEITLILVTHTIEEAAFMGEKILLLGQPPNRVTTVYANSGAGQPGYREKREYQRLCRELRSRLGEQ